MLLSAEYELGACGLDQHLLFKSACIALLLICPLPHSAMAAVWCVWASTWPLEVADAAQLACTSSLLSNLYQDIVMKRKEEDRLLDLEALLEDEEKANFEERWLEEWRRSGGPWQR